MSPLITYIVIIMLYYLAIPPTPSSAASSGSNPGSEAATKLAKGSDHKAGKCHKNTGCPIKIVSFQNNSFRKLTVSFQTQSVK